MSWRAALALLLTSASISAGESQCFGSVSNGRIEHAVQLPGNGANFSAYSSIGIVAGRTWVHSKVERAMTAAWTRLAQTNPEVHFVYGETGWQNGGRLYPHRTHQNGLSVDFFVPVLDAQGRSARLPLSLGNRYGYDLEFDANGRLGELTIDFVAMAEHLHQLARAAREANIGIAMVIFDPPLLPKLFATPRGARLKTELRFMPRRAWVRHDEHYHVDFLLPCARLKR